MYRHGFGDCFLLRFYKGKTVKHKMLIDCGLLTDGVTGTNVKKVVDDIIKETSIKKGNKKVPHLDVLVVTHEHWDHVSAFHPDAKLFDQFDIDKIWMAWTENPKDDEAKLINNHLKDGIVALGIASEKIREKTAAMDTPAFRDHNYQGKEMIAARKAYDVALQNVANFYGPLTAAKKTKKTTTSTGIEVKDNYKIRIDTQKAFDHVRLKLSKGKSGIKYFIPGESYENNNDLPGIRFYALGPPKSSLLNKEKPSGGAKKEVYFGRDASMAGFVKGLLRMSGANQGFDDGSPFTNVEVVTKDKAAKDSYFKSTYLNKNEQWRTIEDDWLDNAGALALQMDEDTNNTSLVLAIEMIGAEKVLLFPGDAQVGNWLSWHEHTWKVKDKDGKMVDVNATRLLNQTVFYKAGHHASHNATLKEKGLELMIHEDLVTFIPEKDGQYRGIPHDDLVTRLHEKCKGRVLFSADRIHVAENTLAVKPDSLSAQEWNAFKKNIENTPLYIEYTVKG